METTLPAIEELQARSVAFVAYTGNYMGNSQIFKDLFSQLAEWACPQGLISSDTVFLSSYVGDPNITPPDELKLDVCMSIPEGTSVDDDAVQQKNLPGGKYAVMHAELTGPEEYGPAWSSVVEWLEKNNYAIDMSRPGYEIYLNDPNEHPEKHHIINICMSVKTE